jgi:hypothetical protein
MDPHRAGKVGGTTVDKRNRLISMASVLAVRNLFGGGPREPPGQIPAQLGVGPTTTARLRCTLGVVVPSWP